VTSIEPGRVGEGPVDLAFVRGVGILDAIEPRRLGQSDVTVSPVIFGAWAVGGWMWGGADEADSIAAIRAAVDNGVTTIDTAAIYAQGYGEEVVGKAIKGLRDKVQIATKCARRWDSEVGSNPWATQDRLGHDITVRSNSRPESIAHECEQSLRRLGVDVIDLFQIHWPDTGTPIEDTMLAMLKLKEQGKIRAIGVSNFDLDWLRRANDVTPLASLQPPFSLLRRKVEADLLPFCREHQVGVIVYSPLERGLLTGTVTPDREFPPGDHRARLPLFSVENRRKVLEALEQVRPIADKHGASLTQLVINWTILEPGITAAIVGARNPEQATHNAGALRFTLTLDERAEIRKAFDTCAFIIAS
jgi:aryl-alcohol dehydrogenase-like predicted oxidoreductase